MKKGTTTLLLALLVFLCLAVSCKNDPSTPPSHEHSFESSWSVDDTYHWHKATCEHTDVVKDKAEHSKDSGVVTKEPSISEDGEKVFSCSVCGKELEKVVLTKGIWVGGGKSLEALLEENDLKSATTWR